VLPEIDHAERGPIRRRRRHPIAEADRETYTVLEAGRKAGLGRVASYAAARSGEMPVIRFGRQLRVPKARWHAILAGDEAA
jgi:hypothetical protein